MIVVRVLNFLLVFLASSVWGQGRPREQLVESVMRTSKLYSTVIPPGKTGDNSPVEVELDFILTFVTDLSDDKMELDGVLRMGWKDSRLAWSRDRYNVSSLHLPQDLVWTPDITPYDMIDVRQRSEEKYAAVVRHDGTVAVVDRVTYRLPCINRSGRRLCRLKLGSWAYDDLAIKVKTRSNQVTINHLAPMTAMKLTESSVTTEEVFFDCCPEAYSLVTYTFGLEPHVGWFD